MGEGSPTLFPKEAGPCFLGRDKRPARGGRVPPARFLVGVGPLGHASLPLGLLESEACLKNLLPGARPRRRAQHGIAADALTKLGYYGPHDV